MQWNILEIKKQLESTLSIYRYQHSLNVMEEAKTLAKHYHADIKKAEVCGLIHDMCKEFTPLENEKFINEHNLSKDLLNYENRNLVHGVIASIIVKEKYNFTNDMILAIRYHSTGYPNMDLLAKIVYLADKIEKNKSYPGIETERILAYKDIDEAIIFCLKNQINCLKKKNKTINPKAYETLNYLENIKSKN